ncbi:hypothetical protein G195_010571 [Phytophthora kernoviae 00238/432]|uniref:Uncharacterized protein n=2 Tax=Phytophthora kernoviae TaxID=325452 RepID=A0A8T0LL22_9STRA|nr:hypothetical protein G195_010571 [Phytophthora kernoviae 00238/432]KAG2507358.1 hypothetical protein JM16_008914 [Phytophthora kernoviae]
MRSFIVFMAMNTMAISSAQEAPYQDPIAVYDAKITNLAPAPPKAFDMYVLAQSWQPAFCHGKERQYPGCTKPQDFWRSHLTLHGLWPELSGSAPPSFCSGEVFDADKVERELGIDTLHQYWPDVKYSEISPQYADFWKHEWTRHGTCSGLPQVAYFTEAINLERNETLAPTPQLVQDNVGRQVDVKKLRAAFGDAALKCQRSHALETGVTQTLFSQVFTCWEKDEHNVPTKRGVCPPHIHSEDTCGYGQVTIPAFPTATRCSID